MIDKVHGLHATGMTLNDRFSILSEVPERPPSRQRRWTPARFMNDGMKARNQAFIDAMARRLERQSKIAALRQRLGLPQPMYRRYGNNFGGMRRSNSFGNLSQASGGNRTRNSLGDFSRSASFSNLSQMGRGNWRRGFRRRGAPNWRFRGNFRGNRQGHFTRLMGVRRGNWIQFRGQVRGRGNGNMGGIRRTQPRQQNPVPSRAELDHQLDEYMASSKFTLDKQLEEYMKTAEMETE